LAVEPRGDLGAFEVVGEDGKAAAGADDDGAAGVFFFGGAIDGDPGGRDVAGLDNAAAGAEFVGVFGEVGLGRERGGVAGPGGGPDVEDEGFGGGGARAEMGGSAGGLYPRVNSWGGGFFSSQN